MSRDAALAAAERGWTVFPLRTGTKFPAVPDHRAEDCDHTDPRCRDGHTGWEPRATTDPDRIRRGWAAEPFNVGVACGPSRLIVIDLDTHGELPAQWRELPGVNDGKDVFAQVCEWAGMDWPWTHTVATPSGGWHLYFTAPENTAIRNSQPSPIGPMVDVRAAGGYVVGAGSVTTAGTYEVLYGDDPIPLPQWIARLLEPKPAAGHGRDQFTASASPDKRIDGLVRTVAAGRPRERTGVLVWAAFILRDMVAGGEAAEADGNLLVQAAVKAGIQGGEPYARGQVQSVLRKGSR